MDKEIAQLQRRVDEIDRFVELNQRALTQMVENQGKIADRLMEAEDLLLRVVKALDLSFKPEWGEKEDKNKVDPPQKIGFDLHSMI